MARFIVEGGTPLRGEIRPAGNKNEALPVIAAALLTAEPVTLHNVPRIRDVRGMLEIASALGAKVEELDPQTVRITAADLKSEQIPASLSREIRASLLFAAPLVARLKRARLGPPGGDVIGRRRNDTHFLALKAFGAELTEQNRSMMYVPEGCAHGYLTLEDDSEVLYPVTEFYHPEAEAGLRWDDPVVSVAWPETPRIVSPKDQAWPSHQR